MFESGTYYELLYMFGENSNKYFNSSKNFHFDLMVDGCFSTFDSGATFCVYGNIENQVTIDSYDIDVVLTIVAGRMQSHVTR